MTYQEQQQAIQDAIAEFPEEFGLRAFPGKVFSISESASYIGQEGIMLYTYVKREDGRWDSFAKGTAAELRRELITL